MPRHRLLPAATSALLFQHLAAMEKAGLPPARAYALLDLGPAYRQRQATFLRLAARGVDPASAGLNSGLFTAFEARLLRAALSAGSPLPTYERLASFHAARVARQRTLRSRLMLPAAMLVMALLVNSLPELVAGHLSGGAFLWQAARPLLLIGAAIGAALHLARWHAAGGVGAARQPFDRLLLAIPLCGPMHLRRNRRDAVESLALLLEAGLPLQDALPVALNTVNNSVVRADLARMLPALQQGATLAHAVGALGLAASNTLFAFVHTGEQSGTLPEMLGRFADTETVAIDAFAQALAAWLPRLAYAGVALWMAAQLLGAPNVPLDGLE